MSLCCIAKPAEEVDVMDNSNWMGELPSHLHDTPLTELAIPGSHDTAAYYLDQNAPFAPDVTKTVQELEKFLGPLLKDLIYRWSITQSLNTTQQLKAGVRYMDIRVSTKSGSQDLYLVHGLYSVKLRDLLTEISAFLSEHTKEIVLLDFNHLYGMTDEIHLQCQDLILETFGTKVCPFIDTDSVTLSMLWENNLQVLVFYHKQGLTNYQLWPGEKIPSPWPDTSDPKKCIDILEKNYQRGHSNEGFYVTQGILTPDTPCVIKHFVSSLKDTLCCKINPPFVDWLKKKKAGKNGINVCIMDFVEMADYIPAVLALNNTI